MSGLYIHIPFCAGKCPYCDFYSLPATEDTMEAYTRRVQQVMAEWTAFPVNTVYFGGGTPNLLGARRLARLLEGAGKSFSISPDAEITVEANPTHVSRSFFADLHAAGFNRLSMGLQSADEKELHLLGRAHAPEDAADAVKAAQAAGFANISLDIMLGLPGGNPQKLKRSIDFAAGLGVQHISAYILKVEPGTPFATAALTLPDEDETADQYLFCVEELARQGFVQYEISNFARPGFESRHNLTYWRGGEYAGIGPGAHSFQGGRRFYYSRDLQGFLAGGTPVDDGPGGSFQEFAMLNLRLVRGLLRAECDAKFGPGDFERILQNARRCPPPLLCVAPDSIHFTPQGFLVSNALLVRLLDGI